MNKQDMGALVVEHYSRMEAIAYNYTRDKDKARDLVQISVERALKAHDSFDGVNPIGWLATIIGNAYRNQCRAETRQAFRSLEALIELEGESAIDERARSSYSSNSAEYLALADTFSPEIMSAWENLTLGQREVIYLIDIQGYSYREASQALHIGEGTIMSRLSRGRKVLREALA